MGEVRRDEREKRVELGKERKDKTEKGEKKKQHKREKIPPLFVVYFFGCY